MFESGQKVVQAASASSVQIALKGSLSLKSFLMSCSDINFNIYTFISSSSICHMGQLSTYHPFHHERLGAQLCTGLLHGTSPLRGLTALQETARLQNICMCMT